MKTVKMVFFEDQFYVTAANKEQDLAQPLYLKGVVYEIEEKMVPRWIKRGGRFVDEMPVEVEAKEEAQPELEDEVNDDISFDEEGDGVEDKKKPKKKSGGRR